MFRRTVVFLAAMAIVVTFAPRSFAQSVTAQLSGTVTDQSGGILPGASVTVTQTATAMTRAVVTGPNGEFVFTNLPIGPYKVAAALPGFNAFEQTGITLNVGDTRSVNITMKLGAVSEMVLVEADANLVQTQSLSVGQVTRQEQIVSLPLNGRDATQLLLLEGGAVGGAGGGGGRTYPGQISISVAGGTNNSTQYLIDGGYNNDPQSNSGNPIPFPDALQEFRTESGVRDARFGMSTGATVNAVTKSGTNTFHGNAFDFARDHRFNSISYFNKTANGGLGRDDGLQRHQFGGTIGGPVRRDKLFFFFGMQATINKQKPTSNQTVVTEEMLRGDFRRALSPPCVTSARTLGAPFVDNQIDPAQFDPLALKILSMVPRPDPALDPDGCGRYVYVNNADSTERQFVSRVDIQATANKRIFFRDFASFFNDAPSFDKNKPNLLDAGPGAGSNSYQHTITTGLDYVVTQHLFSSTRFSFQHTYSVRNNGAGVPTLGMLGVKSWMYTEGKIPGQDEFKAGLWDSGNTGTFYVDTPQVAQDVNWTLGAHSVSFGGSWARPSSNGDGPFQADGALTFDGTITSGTNSANGGLNFADFLLGDPSRYRLGGSQINNAYVHSPGTYASDIFRLNRRITLNYGLRWEPYFAPHDRNGFVTAFVRDNYDKGIRSTVYPNAPLGLLFKGDTGFPDNNANSHNAYNQLAPRFGLVWDPNGDSRQTIRTGFGIYYDSPKLWTTAHHMLNAPFGNTVDALAPTSCPGQPSQNGCPINLLNPWANTPSGDPMINISHQGEPVRLPAANVAFPTSGVYVSMPVDAKPMRSYQYNLSYQRQLMGKMLLDVTYTGNQQRHIWMAGYGENPAVYIPGNCTVGQYPGVTAAAPACSNTSPNNRQARALLTLINPKEGPMYSVNTGGQTGISQSSMDGEGHYNGLKIALQKRMSRGWSANANYTFSKCINLGEPSLDLGWSIPLVTPTAPNYNVTPNLGANKGPCNNDRRHIFNLSSVAISPGIGSGLVSLITKDWQVGLIVQARSGSPLTPGANGDPALTGEPNQRPNVVPGVNPYLANPTWVPNKGGFNTQLQWIDMTAFVNPDIGGHGNAARGSLFGPHFWNTDLSFSRNVNYAGGRRVELRLEAFNLFNTVNWGNPNVSVGSSSAGRITGTSGDPRIMQFAMKYGF